MMRIAGPYGVIKESLFDRAEPMSRLRQLAGCPAALPDSVQDRRYLAMGQRPAIRVTGHG